MYISPLGVLDTFVFPNLLLFYILFSIQPNLATNREPILIKLRNFMFFVQIFIFLFRSKITNYFTIHYLITGQAFSPCRIFSIILMFAYCIYIRLAHKISKYKHMFSTKLFCWFKLPDLTLPIYKFTC